MSRLRAPGAAVLLVLAAASCGVPSDPTPIAISQVPYDLMSPAAPPTAAPTTPARRGPFIYLLDAQDRLVRVEAQLGDNTPSAAVSAILQRLATGPTENERRAGLSTALGPAFVLSLRSLESGRAEVEVETGSPEPAPERLPLGVGQIVLSVTSVPGVSSVVLTKGGTPIDAPLPGGARTSLPLTRADFLSLLEPRTPSAPGVAPTSH